MNAVLGVDPGTRKVGFAVVGPDGEVLARGIEDVTAMGPRIRLLAEQYAVDAIALGRGTNAREMERELSALGLAPVFLVDERDTTLRARALYFTEHPPRGWRKFIPLGMQVPPEPIDDYAAALIARRYLAAEGHPSFLV